MPIFELENIEAIRGCQQFDKLKVDGECPIDNFVDNLEERYETEMDMIYAYMDMVANNQSLPYTKFHTLDKGCSDGCREYEFKTKHLRVYAISQTGGKIIILGGYKNSQKRDIVSFRALKKQYIDSINSKNNENTKRTSTK